MLLGRSDLAAGMVADAIQEDLLCGTCRERCYLLGREHETRVCQCSRRVDFQDEQAVRQEEHREVSVRIGDLTFVLLATTPEEDDLGMAEQLVLQGQLRHAPTANSVGDRTSCPLGTHSHVPLPPLRPGGGQAAPGVDNRRLAPAAARQGAQLGACQDPDPTPVVAQEVDAAAH